MFWWLLASLASAGTVYIDCESPVLAKLDGQLVRKDPATRIIIPDLSEGDYKVEITNLVGASLAFTTVAMNWDDDVYLEYANRRLAKVVDEEEYFVGDDTRSVVPDSVFTKMERKLVKGSLKKRLAIMDKSIGDHALTMRQVDMLLSSFHSRQDRLAALYQLIDSCSEPDKYFALNHHFGVDSDRAKMHALFEATLAAE